jgi:arylsulfatase A-like enzyme
MTDRWNFPRTPGFLRRLMKFRSLLSSILVSGLSALHAAPDKHPNVIVFLVDDMGWMDCEPYGSQYYETPNMSRFAAQSMRFTQAYSVPLCSPTRATIQSGQYSARHGITSASGHQPAAEEGASRYPDKAAPTSQFLYPISKNYLDPGLVTLAEVLKGEGYRTGHFGKWHLGIAPEHRPDQHGYETSWFCVPDPGPPSYFSPYGVQTEGRPAGKTKIGNITDGPGGEYITDRLTDEVLKFLEAHRDEPFFLNLCQYGVHGPWGHKEAYTAEFAKKTDPRGEQRNPIMASMIRSVDESLGRVLDKLDELGLADDTLFLFTSDNGGNVHSNREDDRKTANLKPENPKNAAIREWRKWAGGEGPTNNAPLREGKGRIYEGGQRVPLMIRWPGRVAPGTTSDAVVAAIDYYPTILDAVGAPRPKGQVVDGISLMPVLEGKGSIEREAVFTWFPHLIPAVSVRAGDWKLIYRWEPHREYPETRELYDLKNDPGETRNLAKEYPDQVAKLEKLIEQFIADTGAGAPIPNPAWKAPVAPKPTAATATSDGLVPRLATLEVDDGALVVTGTGPRPFLGTAQARFPGPLKVRLEIKAPEGGNGQMQWRTGEQEDFPEEGQVVDYTLSGSPDWQEISLDLPVEGTAGTIRLYLPAAKGKTVAIRSYRIEGRDGRAKEWRFGE